MSQANPVHSLNPEVARKIAAGEVIDRPNAIVRELLDNSIDSGAQNITVEISGGGIEKIRIIDDGCGMTKEDLQNCARPHATSKINTEVDLMNLTTLGFRGEALASIAAVSRLSITSSGWKMRASITEDHVLEPVAQTKGTIVQSEGLFENFPARRQFLKRPATEGIMCKNTFIEKAMSRTDISFRLIMDGETKLDLPAGQSLTQRFLTANAYSEPEELFYELSGSSGGENPDWSFNLVIGEPSVARSNKKEISIYANGRKIQEYSLVQAVEYGGQGYFPNGTYPVAAVFVTVRPDQIDFNIHPAKKEARFYDISALHHGLSSTIKAFFQQYTNTTMKEDDDFGNATNELVIENHQINKNEPVYPESPYSKHISYKQVGFGEKTFTDYRAKYLGGEIFSSHKNNLPTTHSSDQLYNSQVQTLAEQALASQTNTPPAPIRFLGCCLGTFLLAEKNNSLYIVDQHAAHERILFDKIMKNQNGNNCQPLLIPYKISTESKTQDNQLEKLKDKLTQIGFTTKKIADGNWEICTVPDRWTLSEYDLKTLLFVKHVEPDEIIRSIAAMTACKAAVKDGYVLDDETAARLVEQAFTLEDPHCPHGRPIYTFLSREKLFELVKRT